MIVIEANMKLGSSCDDAGIGAGGRLYTLCSHASRPWEVNTLK